MTGPREGLGTFRGGVVQSGKSGVGRLSRVTG